MQIDPYAGLSNEAREKCIARMARTLKAKPRSPKTRAYVKSLSGKPETEAELRARAMRQFEVARVVKPEKKPTIRTVRKQRISPFAPKSERRHPLKYCRRASRFQRGLSSASPREPRDMQEIAALRIKLNDIQGGLCAICGTELRGDISIDHVIPHAILGKHGDGNFVAVHGECNGDKSNDIPTGCEMIWLLYVNSRLGLHPQAF